MKSKKRNYIVTLPTGEEVRLFSYQIAIGLKEYTGGHLLIIIN